MSSLELTDDADVISYEEYDPFGNSSYQAGRSLAEVSLKRYRYVGKERDEESGFYYIGARYYCPWLARWLETDPINNEWYNLTHGNPTRNTERQFVELTASGYEYCYANPVRFSDLTGEQVTWRNDAVAQRRMISEGLNAWQQAHPGQNLPVAKEQEILTTDLDGKGYMGPKSQVNLAVKLANAAHNDVVGENARSGLGGAYGFKYGGERGAAIGSQLFDNVIFGAHFYKAKAEPVRGQRSLSTRTSTEATRTEARRADVQITENLGREINTLNDPRAYELATVKQETNSIPLTKKTFGHTFTTHGENTTQFLLKRAAGSGQPQGQFLDNQIAAQFILKNMDKTTNGSVDIPIPKDFPARVIMPDGTFSEPTHIRLVPSGDGVKTAYPLIK